MKTRWSNQQLNLFKTEPFDNQLLRTIAHGHFGGSSIGECLEIATHITDGDFDSWYQSWYDFAKKLESKAIIYHDAKDFKNAGTLYLRASNYYRTANTFLTSADERKKKCWQKSRDSFLRFIKHSSYTLNEMSIPYKDISLSGYFLSPDNTMRERPTILCLNGGDSTNEEMYFYIGKTALERGFNFVVFEGIGQNGCILKHPDYKFIPNYESVVIPVIDYIFNKYGKSILKEEFCLYGLSFGGYFAIRTAAVDSRVKYLIVNPPYLNFGKVQEEALGSPLNRIPLKFLDKLVGIVTKYDSLMNYAFETYKDILGVTTPSELFARLNEFSTEKIIEDIQCPVLMLIGESEGTEIRKQAQEIYARIKGDNELRVVFDSEGGGAHCITNNLLLMNELVFHWLSKRIQV